VRERPKVKGGNAQAGLQHNDAIAVLHCINRILYAKSRYAVMQNGSDCLDWLTVSCR
jgi:hypothetical protein